MEMTASTSPAMATSSGQNQSNTAHDSFQDPSVGSGTDMTPTQEPPTKSKKRKNHRGGVAKRVKRVNALFDHDKRQKCDQCEGKPTSWSCSSCSRTLPKGKWSDLRLGAEDEDDSMFGRFRLLADAGVFTHEEQGVFYQQAQDIVKAFEAFGVLSENWNTGKERAAKLTPEIRKRFAMLFQPWAKDQLSSEDREDSCMGMFKKLIRSGVPDLNGALDWAWLAGGLAKSWVKFQAAGTEAREGPPAWHHVYPDFTNEDVKNHVFETLQGPAVKKERLQVTESDASLAIPEADVEQSESSRTRSPAVEAPSTSKHEETQDQTPGEKGTTKEDLMKRVQTRYDQLKAGEAENEQARKELRARNFQLEARKARSLGQRRKILDQVPSKANDHIMQTSATEETTTALQRVPSGEPTAVELFQSSSARRAAVVEKSDATTSAAISAQGQKMGLEPTQKQATEAKPIEGNSYKNGEVENQEEEELGSEDEVIVFKPRGKK